MLEIRHLKTLTAVAECGHISLAAKRLHLTQSALSHQLKALEQHFGTELFKRKSNPLKLSAVGQRLLNLSYQVMESIQAAEIDVLKLTSGQAGNLRIAVECHTCFDWLMPAMDSFREKWLEIELDLVSGFHPDPLALLDENRADVVIVSEKQKRAGIVFHPLFQFEIVALLAKHHPLIAKPYLVAQDFSDQMLITYPVPADMIDLIRYVLEPANIHPKRRTAELTVAILQLVASGRGVAALPGWSVHAYIDRGYVIAKQIKKNGLFSNLYAATTQEQSQLRYMQDFMKVIKKVSFANLQGISKLGK